MAKLARGSRAVLEARDRPRPPGPRDPPDGAFARSMPCYDDWAMHALRIAMRLLVILVWGLFVPFAMAADHCAAMGSMCEGPCGASSTATAPAVPTYTVLVSRAPSMPAPAVPQSDRSTLEPPPKPLVHSA